MGRLMIEGTSVKIFFLPFSVWLYFFNINRVLYKLMKTAAIFSRFVYGAQAVRGSASLEIVHMRRRYLAVLLLHVKLMYVTYICFLLLF